MAPITRSLVSAVALLAVLGAPTASARDDGRAASQVEQVWVPVGAEPDGDPVRIDADIYRPAEDSDGPHEAVLLAHGFGGSKDGPAEQATALTDDGYLVMTYSARGFGDSGGDVHLNDPDYEIADALALIDLLAEQPGVPRTPPATPGWPSPAGATAVRSP
ncbi:CocE/NonD family hydrolase [Janibacter limosus]|uniref:CocE/NonD family hydrolase n=1 Tax=Janibacter limosus TaxID=53458 RepID=A0AC61U3Y0_9MICO|nr:CocE/NonD family hydrolase [Janibacter limosus]UUZ44699.1 CocE/NonD family hydrolase [Janibacter limosus]